MRSTTRSRVRGIPLGILLVLLLSGSVYGLFVMESESGTWETNTETEIMSFFDNETVSTTWNYSSTFFQEMNMSWNLIIDTQLWPDCTTRGFTNITIDEWDWYLEIWEEYVVEWFGSVSKLNITIHYRSPAVDEWWGPHETIGVGPLGQRNSLDGPYKLKVWRNETNLVTTDLRALNPGLSWIIDPQYIESGFNPATYNVTVRYHVEKTRVTGPSDGSGRATWDFETYITDGTDAPIPRGYLELHDWEQTSYKGFWEGIVDYFGQIMFGVVDAINELGRDIFDAIFGAGVWDNLWSAVASFGSAVVQIGVLFTHVLPYWDVFLVVGFLGVIFLAIRREDPTLPWDFVTGLISWISDIITKIVDALWPFG